MQEIPVVPMQYLNLRDIEDVPALSEDERACFSEVRAVLDRHRLLDRLGLCLLHKHFDVADDEVLLETCNVTDRTLLARPVKRSRLDETNVQETSWYLGTNAAMQGCKRVCEQDYTGKHVKGHDGHYTGD